MEGSSVNRFSEPLLGSAIEELAWSASEELLSPLPNDLTRIVYLASIRDYNSGTYRHPQLSRQFGAATAHRALELWHEEVFGRLLINSVASYVEQLEGYLRYSRAERGQFIQTWKLLQAYKAAVPLHLPPRAREAFFLNVEAALAILENPS